MTYKNNIQANRFYIGDYEIYSKKTNGTLDTERETLHINDDKSKVALIDYDTQNLTTTIRYQYTNHLDSASLELDETGDIISYEEYHPFGTTSYRSGRNDIDVSLKRYKYVHKELDNETGLIYYGLRFYAPWIARFISVDPLQFDYPIYTPYQYAGNKPISFIDLDGAEENKINNTSDNERLKKGAKLYVVSMGWQGYDVGDYISKWSVGTIEHIKVPENQGRNTMSYIVNKMKETDNYEKGVGLIMLIGVHGYVHRPNPEDNDEGSYRMYAYNREYIADNKIADNDWEMLREIKYMENCVIFSSSCNFATPVPKLDGSNLSLAEYLSTFTNGMVIGAYNSGSSGNIPHTQDTYFWTVDSKNLEYLIAENGEFISTLGSLVSSKSIIQMAKDALMYEMLKAEDSDTVIPKIKGNQIQDVINDKELIQLLH